jgi:hypothetical protein
MSYLSETDYLLACKEERAREFATYLFTALFEEFSDTYSRQGVFYPPGYSILQPFQFIQATSGLDIWILHCL